MRRIRAWSARTSFQGLDLLHGLLRLLGTLLELGDLDLLAELLQIPLLPRLCAGLLARRLVDQLRLDLRHVLVRLHHLGEVVRGSREGYALCLQRLPRFLHGGQRLRVEGEFAVEIVRDVGDGDGLGGGD